MTAMTWQGWLRAAAYAAAAGAVGFAGLASLTIGACDPYEDGRWCGGDPGKLGEGYVAGTVMFTLGWALAARAVSRRARTTLLAGTIGLGLCAWFVLYVELA
jgi:hypothetical protein